MKTKKNILLIIALMGCIFSYAQNINVQVATYKHKPIVEMTINDKKAWFLLDTGSDITILNIEAKDSYGFRTYLRYDARYKVPGFGSENNQLHQVSKANLKFGDTKLNKPIFAFNITNIANSIEGRTGKRITGIMGTNMMRSYGFIIDMGNSTVVMSYKGKKKQKLVESLSVAKENNSDIPSKGK